MCNKLFAVLLVLGFVAGAGAVDFGDLYLHYTFDAADDIGGMVTNGSVIPGDPPTWKDAGVLGELAMGQVVSNSSDGYQYTPSLIGEGMVLTNDGPIPPADPAVVNNEMADTVDIETTTETDPLWRPFEDKTISIWFRQDLPINPDNHCGQWTSDLNYIFATYGPKTRMMMMILPSATDPFVGPDKLVFRAGGRSISNVQYNTPDLGNIEITLGEWHHAVLTLTNIDGPEGSNCLARAYLDGVMVGVGKTIRASDQYKSSAYWDYPVGANIGAYQFDENTNYEAADGITVDDFAVYQGGRPGQDIAGIYAEGLQGIAAHDIPEPATIALLGLGALALLRKRS